MRLININNECKLFSIIVPAYNSASFINKCIDSILGQTCRDFELILVDDGSCDNTLEICQSYAKNDFRVKVIHKDNGGHTSARNEGLKYAEGQYVLFVDSDDWLAKQTLEMCKSEILYHNSDIVVFRIINSTDTDPFPVLIPNGYYNVSDIENVIRDKLIIGADGRFVFPKSLSAKCFKRELITSSQLEVPKEILIGEDGAAFVGAVFRSKSISVISDDDRSCYFCLVRTDSVSRTADPHAFKRAVILLNFYCKILDLSNTNYRQQFYRYIVAQLYTAVLMVMRSGGGKRKINAGLDQALKIPTFSCAVKKARFNLRGYRYIIKKFILRYRLWSLAKLIDG